MAKLTLLLGSALFLTIGCNAPIPESNLDLVNIPEDEIVPEQEHVLCMAKNIYFEARAEPVEGQVAVANVVLNRVKSEEFPDDPCHVIYQGGERRRHKCQFSWYCDGKTDRVRDLRKFEELYVIAYNAMSGEYEDNTYGATFYHANYVNPRWAYQKERTVILGNHIFYR